MPKLWREMVGDLILLGCWATVALFIGAGACCGVLCGPAQAVHISQEERTRRRKECFDRLASIKSDLESSDVFNPQEKGNLLSTLASLKNTGSFECKICFEKHHVATPVHGHDSTCTKCLRNFAESEVAAGRVPTCPTCRSDLKMMDLAAIGASERTIVLAQKFLRERLQGVLAMLVTSNDDVLAADEVTKIQTVLEDQGVDFSTHRVNDRASQEFIRRTATLCPSCGSPCHRISGCPLVTCRCGREFVIQHVAPGPVR